MSDHRIVIIGAGVAGLSIAIWLRRFGCDPVVIEEGHTTGGQLLWVGNSIIDYPGVVASTGSALAARFHEHADSLHAKIMCGITVHALRVGANTLETSKGTFRYSSLVIATGCRPQRLHVPGEEAMVRRGDTYIVARDRDLFRERTVVVIGGGDRAVEGAILLAEAGARVVLIHRSEEFRARKHFLDRAKADKNIRILVGAVVTEILGHYGVSAVAIRHKGSTSTVQCCAVFIRVGVLGNTQFISDSIATSKDGFVKIDSSCKTSVDNIWAIGDVASPAPILSVSTAVGHAALVAKQLSLEEKSSTSFSSRGINNSHAHLSTVPTEQGVCKSVI